MLNNTQYLLENGKKLCIGYFGGSITEAAHGYRDKVNAALREKYPQAEITEIMAAIGGTGSDLGMYRCGRDLMAGKPDLIFYEFAVNDRGSKYNNILIQTETIFREIYRTNPMADIVVLFTSSGHVNRTLEAGDEYHSRAAQSAVAHHYGLPIIDIGEVLRSHELRANQEFKAYTTDLTHPNDAGHQLYADCILGKLDRWLHGPMPTEMVPHIVPDLFCKRIYDKARMEDCAEIATDICGFTAREISMCDRYPRYFEGTQPGDSFSFTFAGENAGFYWMMAKDSGDLLVSVDGSEEMSLRSWDHYCKDFNRANAIFFARNLPYGEHTVRVRIAHTKDEESEGTAIRIGTVLIS